MKFDEFVTRERVRDTYARYSHAGDRYRLDELVSCFAVDGILEIKGDKRATGRENIAQMLGVGAGGRRSSAGTDGRPPIVRHFVTNLLFENISAERVESTAYFCVVTRAGEHSGMDHWGRYRDVLVPEGDRWVFAHRLVALDAAVPGGWYAGSDG